MSEPPSLDEPVKVTVMLALPCTTAGCAGALGTVAGTTGDEAMLGSELPSALVATTVQVYCFPFVSADTTIGEDAPEFEPGEPPLLDVQDAVNPVIGLPLSLRGTNATEIDALPAVTLGF